MDYALVEPGMQRISALEIERHGWPKAQRYRCPEDSCAALVFFHQRGVDGKAPHFAHEPGAPDDCPFRIEEGPAGARRETEGPTTLAITLGDWLKLARLDGIEPESAGELDRYVTAVLAVSPDEWAEHDRDVSVASRNLLGLLRTSSYAPLLRRLILDATTRPVHFDPGEVRPIANTVRGAVVKIPWGDLWRRHLPSLETLHQTELVDEIEPLSGEVRLGLATTPGVYFYDNKHTRQGELRHVAPATLIIAQPYLTSRNAWLTVGHEAGDGSVSTERRPVVLQRDVRIRVEKEATAVLTHESDFLRRRALLYFIPYTRNPKA